MGTISKSLSFKACQTDFIPFKGGSTNRKSLILTPKHNVNGGPKPLHT